MARATLRWYAIEQDDADDVTRTISRIVLSARLIMSVMRAIAFLIDVGNACALFIIFTTQHGSIPLIWLGAAHEVISMKLMQWLRRSEDWLSCADYLMISKQCLTIASYRISVISSFTEWGDDRATIFLGCREENRNRHFNAAILSLLIIIKLRQMKAIATIFIDIR